MLHRVDILKYWPKQLKTNEKRREKRIRYIFQVMADWNIPFVSNFIRNLFNVYSTSVGCEIGICSWIEIWKQPVSLLYTSLMCKHWAIRWTMAIWEFYMWQKVKIAQALNVNGIVQMSDIVHSKILYFYFIFLTLDELIPEPSIHRWHFSSFLIYKLNGFHVWFYMNGTHKMLITETIRVQ